MPITLRSAKGAPLTHAEMDANWGVVSLLSAGLVLASVAGAVGNGVANDTTPISTVMASDGIKILGHADYYTPGAVSAFAHPTVILADNASRSGSLLPLITLGKLHWTQLPKTYMFIRQDTADRNDNATVRIERIVNTDDGIANPKTLRVVTINNMASSSQAEWAISGELQSYTNITGAGGVATSGVTFKYGLGGVFAGHFQNNEMFKHTSTTAVTATVGVEMNIQVVGADHPTANDGIGNRIVLDILGRTNSDNVANWNVDEGDNYGEGEVGALARFRTDNLTGSYARYGVVITDAGNTGKIGTGLWIKTNSGRSIYVTGNVTGSHIQVAGNSAWGLVLSGSYSTSAIRITTANYLAFDTTDTNRMAYGVTTNLLAMYSSATERFGFNMSNGNLRINSLEVLRARETGWTADTGTAKKTANATYSGTASVSYVQAEMTAVMNALRDATQTIKAIKDLAIYHGIAGT